MSDDTATAQRKWDDARMARTHRFVSTVMALMRDFLPSDRDILRRIEDSLIEAGLNNNLEIISVPPGCDAMDKLQLSMAPIVKRVGMQISRDEVKEFAEFTASNLKVEPFPMRADFRGPPCHPDGFWAAEVTGLTPGRAICSVCGFSPQSARK